MKFAILYLDDLETQKFATIDEQKAAASNAKSAARPFVTLRYRERKGRELWSVQEVNYCLKV